MAVFRVKKNDNYTVMSNYHLKDRQLSLKAKGLLSLMLSLPEDWDYTLRGLAIISKDGIDSINSAIKELTVYGYIKRERVRNEKGQLEGSDYEIFEHPQLDVTEPISVKPTLEKPRLENPILDIPAQVKPALENPVQLNTNIQKTKELNTNQSINQSMEDAIEQIRKNIDYDILKTEFDSLYLNEIVELMAEVIRTQRDYWEIAGSRIGQEDMQRRIRMLDSSHIRYVLECFKDNTNRIYNIKNYLLAALYNAPSTIDHYYRQQVMSDQSAGIAR